MIDLQAYLPINTTEKVDQLITELESADWPADMATLELSIRMEIRKAKIQFYFQEQFVHMRMRHPKNKIAAASSKTIKPNTVKELVPPTNGTKEEHALCRKFIGSTIIQVAYQMEKEVHSLIRTLNGFGVDLTPESLFTNEIYEKTKAYISNYLYVKNRSANLKSIEEEQLAAGFMKKKEKFKTSYGREGNYSKLIYAQPKS